MLNYSLRQSLCHIPLPVGESTCLTSSCVPFSQQNVGIRLRPCAEVYFFAVDGDNQESDTWPAFIRAADPHPPYPRLKQIFFLFPFSQVENVKGFTQEMLDKPLPSKNFSRASSRKEVIRNMHLIYSFFLLIPFLLRCFISWIT